MTKEEKDQERFIVLRAAGRPYEDISSELKVPVETLVEWAKDVQKDLDNAKTIQKADLFERYPVGKGKRIQVFGNRLEAIMTELDKRDLSDVPTDKLLSLALKYGDALKGEREDLVLIGEPMGFQIPETLETWTP